MSTPRRLLERVRTLVPPWSALGGLGAVMVAVGTWNFVNEIRLFGTAIPVIGAAALNLSLSTAVLYAAVSIRQGPLADHDAWTVVAGGFGGGALAAVAQGLTFAIRLAEGRPVSEPQFPLIVVGSIGVLGGVVVGRQFVIARQRAREAEEARDAMAFTNSLLRHDVLNGLQVIHANADALSEADDEWVRERAAPITSQSESVMSLLTEVKSVSAVLTGDVDRRPVDLSATLSDIVEAMRGSYPGATIEYDCPPNLLVEGTDAIEPVFSNLLTNAVQHVGEDVRIRVHAERDGEWVSTRVADDGPGIPPEERDRILQQGVSTDGGGQGLYVADTIVDRLGGHITVEESEWGGAAFVVTLPAADVEPH